MLLGGLAVVAVGMAVAVLSDSGAAPNTPAVPAAARTQARVVETAVVPREVTVAPATRAANPTISVATAVKPVTITIVSDWSGAYGTALSAAARDYEKAHPGITIAINNQQTDLYSYLKTITAAGSGPDIVATYSSQIGQMSADGLILALDDYKIDLNFMLSSFVPSAVNGIMFKGKIWGLPEYIEGIELIYNKKLVTSQYLPLNTNDWSGLLSAATQFQKDNPGKTLVCNSGFAGGDAYHIAPVFFGNGVPAYVDETGKVYVNTPEAVKAMQWLRSMLPVSQKAQDYTSCTTAFKDGKVGIWWTGPWTITEIETAKIDYGIFAMGRPFASGGSLMLGKAAVTRKSTDTALDIMKYLAGVEAQKKFALAAKTAPATISALYSPEIQASSSLFAFGTALQNGVPIGPTPYSSTQWGPVGDAVKTIWTNPASSIPDVLKTAQLAIEAAVSKMK